MNTLMAVLIAVLNSLWQAALLAALVWLALRFASRINAATRFAIWWTVLAIVIVLPAAPRIVGAAREWLKPTVIQSTRPLYAPSSADVPGIELTPLVSVESGAAAGWPLLAAAVWGAILLYRLARLMRSYIYLSGVKRRASISVESLPPTGRAAALLLSPAIDSPIAVGFARPAVILPDSLPSSLSPEELHHVLLHETAHLARWDDYTNLLAHGLAAALALHPVALWILQRIEIERESACDDWVVSRTRSVKPYAKSLVRLYELRVLQQRAVARELLASGIFGRGSRLSERIETLRRRSGAFTSRVSMARVVASMTVLICLAVIASFSPRWILLAQAPRPTFDVASVKRRTEESNQNIFAVREGGRLIAVNNPLSNVIANAYGILDYQLTGAPDWVNSERYDIEAKGQAIAGRKDMMLMLQTLLTDRFAMKARFETREMPAWLLTVAKGGPKMRMLGPDDCVALLQLPFDTKPNPDTMPNVCGNNMLSRNGVWTGTHISMPQVTRLLSSAMRGPVINQTAIKGTFDVNMQWSDDLAAADNAGDAPPSIFAALRETLGLELKSGRGPVEVLVIDHIERPSAN
jgi:uncharacterized protein (TIGR03435 family)